MGTHTSILVRRIELTKTNLGVSGIMMSVHNEHRDKMTTLTTYVTTKIDNDTCVQTYIEKMPRMAQVGWVHWGWAHMQDALRVPKTLTIKLSDRTFMTSLPIDSAELADMFAIGRTMVIKTADGREHHEYVVKEEDEEPYVGVPVRRMNAGQQPWL